MRIDVVTDTYEPDVNGVALTLGRLVGGLRMRGHLVHLNGTALSTLGRRLCRPFPSPCTMR